MSFTKEKIICEDEDFRITKVWRKEFTGVEEYYRLYVRTTTLFVFKGWFCETWNSSLVELSKIYSSYKKWNAL